MPPPASSARPRTIAKKPLAVPRSRSLCDGPRLFVARSIVTSVWGRVVAALARRIRYQNDIILIPKVTTVGRPAQDQELGLKSRAAELRQYRRPVGSGPSGKT